MKKLLKYLLILTSLAIFMPGCAGKGVNETTPATTPAEETIPTETVETIQETETTIATEPTAPRLAKREAQDPTEGVMPEFIYYVGPEREHKSLTKLFMQLQDNHVEKVIFVDEGTYDMFKEYKEAGVASPPDDVSSPDYFDYNVFLPVNTKLIGIGNVRLEFNPSADEITYGESRTWSPLNILGECHIENIEIYCKNGRYCIHDDSHNQYQGSTHYYKNVRTIYEYSDLDSQGRRLGFNNTIGNGIAQGTNFIFEDCYFEFKGSDKNSAFYTHESGNTPGPLSTLTFIDCTFKGGLANSRTVRLQNLATADVRVITTFQDCDIEGGIYLTIYKETSAQHFDVTLINSGNPMQMIDDMANNRFPIKVYK